MTSTHPAALRDQLVDALHPSTAVRPITERAVARLADDVDDPDLLEAIVTAAVNPEGIGTHELARRAGCSERQVRYWTEEGFIAARPREQRGQGYPIAYDPGVVTKTRMMGALVRLFGMGPREASTTADRLIADGKIVVRGFTITRNRFDR